MFKTDAFRIARQGATVMEGRRKTAYGLQPALKLIHGNALREAARQRRATPKKWARS